MLHELVLEQFDAIIKRFTLALARQLPDLAQDQLLWRFIFMVGAMAHTMSMAAELKNLSGGQCDPSDVDGLIGAMVPFVAAGFRAPATS